jgi:hypothetical protein
MWMTGSVIIVIVIIKMIVSITIIIIIVIIVIVVVIIVIVILYKYYHFPWAVKPILWRLSGFGYTAAEPQMLRQTLYVVQYLITHPPSRIG